MFRALVTLILIVGFNQTFASGDAAHGKELTPVCAACHGQDGNSPAGTFPSLSGQQPKYLIKQLEDIKSGDRDAPLMAGLLDSLSEQDFADIAAYYQEQPRKRGAAKADLVELGESIYRSGITRKKITACTACHLPGGEGINAAGFPAISGQWPEYTKAQLDAFRSGARHNDGDGKIMRTTAMDLSDHEIDAVASYLYGLKE